MQTYQRYQLPTQPERAPEAPTNRDRRPPLIALPVCLITAGVVAFLAINAWHQQTPAPTRPQAIAHVSTPKEAPIATTNDLRTRALAEERANEARAQRVRIARHASAVRARQRKATRRTHKRRAAAAAARRKHQLARVLRTRQRVLVPQAAPPTVARATTPRVTQAPAQRARPAPAPSSSGGTPPAPTPSNGGAPSCNAFDFC
jgi:hypothetical protein